MARANKLERYMLTLINHDRKAAGLDPLRLDNSLNASAERHSEWMLNRDIFSHSGAGGSSPENRMQEAGYALRGNWRSGENIALQSERGAAGLRDDVRDLHQRLMQSPEHRANILNPAFHEIGIGLERGMFRLNGSQLDALVVTEDFGRTSTRSSQQAGAQKLNAEKAAAQANSPSDENTLTAAHSRSGPDHFALRDADRGGDHVASLRQIADRTPDHSAGTGSAGDLAPALLQAGEDAFDFGASGHCLLG
jgi:serralysin